MIEKLKKFREHLLKCSTMKQRFAFAFVWLLGTEKYLVVYVSNILQHFFEEIFLFIIKQLENSSHFSSIYYNTEKRTFLEANVI